MSAEASAFVGRDAEVARLDAAFGEVMAGRGRLVLMGGEPGIGKTRLTDEFAGRARAHGADVLWGRCWEAGGAPPFWPWVECVRAYAEGRDAETLRADLGAGAPDIAQMVPELRRIVPDVPEPAGGDPEAARFRLFDALATFLRSAGLRSPLVLVLEDLHAADEPSLLLLRFVARTLPRARVLVLGTYRDTELSRDHPLTATLVELGREASVNRLLLSGLTLDAVASFVDAVAGHEAAPQLVEAVYRETEGNPLFVAEVVRMLAGEGRLDAPPEATSWAGLIPPGVREVIDRRLNRLSERCLRVLTRGSAVGRDFSIEVMQRLNGMSPADLLAALDEAAVARVVMHGPAGVGWMRFSHQLVRDALYESLPPGERAVLHRQVAEALLEIHGDPTPVLAEVAHHFYEAAPGGDASMAVLYCMRAGEQAAAILAYEEAVRLYGMAHRAVDLASDVDDTIRAEILVRLGESRARAGDVAGAKEAFFNAAEFAERQGLARHLARAALGYGGRFVWARAGQDRRLVPLLERALAAVGDADDALRARLLARLAGALRDQFDPRPRDELSREAVAIARRLADPPTLAYVLDGRWAAIWGPDTTEDRLELAGQLIGAAEAAGDGERAFQGHHYRMICVLERGEVRRAREELATKERIAGELRQPAQRWYLSASRALLTIFEGRLSEGEELAEQALTIGERAYSSWDARFTHLLQLFAIRREQGRLRELEAALRRSVDEYEGSYPFIRAVVALALAEIGETGEAAGLVHGLVERGEVRLPRDNEWIFGMAMLGEVLTVFEDRDRAGIVYEALAPYAGTNALAPIEAMTGAVDRYLGLLAATLGRQVDAARHFAQALELNRRMGAEPAAVRTLLDQARTMVSSGDVHDRQRAIGSLTEAVESGRRIRADALVATGDALLRELGHEPPGYERVLRAFMFTDIVGSTALLDAIGDEGWQDLRAWHDRTLRDLFAEHGGEEIDHAGDGFFVAFPGGREALECAVQIQRSLAEHRRTHGFAPQVRIGIHAGEATRSDGGYVGRAVHVAARIGSLADGGQILASVSALRDQKGPRDQGDRRRVTLKGIAEPVEIAAVPWRP